MHIGPSMNLTSSPVLCSSFWLHPTCPSSLDSLLSINCHQVSLVHLRRGLSSGGPLKTILTLAFVELTIRRMWPVKWYLFIGLLEFILCKSSSLVMVRGQKIYIIILECLLWKELCYFVWATVKVQVSDRSERTDLTADLKGFSWVLNFIFADLQLLLKLLK